jgi:hypothetical protein
MEKSPNQFDQTANVHPSTLDALGSGKIALPPMSGQRRSRRAPKPNSEAVVYQEIIDPLVVEYLKQRLTDMHNPDNNIEIAQNLENNFSSYIITRSEALRVLNLKNYGYSEPLDGVVTLTNKDVVLCNSPEHKKYFLSNHGALKQLFKL